MKAIALTLLVLGVTAIVLAEEHYSKPSVPKYGESEKDEQIQKGSSNNFSSSSSNKQSQSGEHGSSVHQSQSGSTNSTLLHSKILKSQSENSDANESYGIYEKPEVKPEDGNNDKSKDSTDTEFKQY